jgi:opacity protein-like surface antigen
MKFAACVVLAASACLQGCESLAGLRGRFAAGAGLTNLKVRNAVDSDTADGGQQSVRAELAQPLDYLLDLEVGVRLKGGVREIDDRFFGEGYDFESRQLALTPTLRSFWSLSESSRLYGEAFAGYEYFWGEGRPLDVTARGDDGGLAYGVGMGMEFDVTKANALSLGLEWSRLEVQENGLDSSFDDFSAIVGWAMRF